MANKKYNELTAGTPVGTDLIAYGDPSTGVLKKVTLDNMNAAVGLMKTIEINLTPEDIATMKTTPITIIPGVAGKIISIDRVTTVFRYGTVAYTAGGHVLLRDDSNATVLISNIITQGSVNGSADKVMNAYPNVGSSLIVEGAGVEVTNATADFATGDGTLKLIITYQVITL